MTTEAKKEPTVPGSVVAGKKVKEVIPVRGIRRTLAEHMHAAFKNLLSCPVSQGQT